MRSLRTVYSTCSNSARRSFSGGIERRPTFAYMASNFRSRQIVVQLLHQHALAAHGIQHLQQQRPQEFFGRNRTPPDFRIHGLKLPISADCSPVAPSACARCARYTAPAATAPAGVFRAESNAARLSHTWPQTADLGRL